MSREQERATMAAALPVVFQYCAHLEQEEVQQLMEFLLVTEHSFAVTPYAQQKVRRFWVTLRGFQAITSKYPTSTVIWHPATQFEL